MTLPALFVNNTEEINSVLHASRESGAIIYLSSGQYRPLLIDSFNQTEQNPIIVAPLEDAVVDFCFDHRAAIELIDCSYMAFVGLKTSSGLDGCSASRSNHIIFKGMDISRSRQAGVKISHNSSFVDVLESKIYDTGQQNPQYGEGVYVGTGGNDGWPDTTNNIIIEGNEISRTGCAEAVDIKAEVCKASVRANVINEISPARPEYSQVNQAAISISGREHPKYRHNLSREIWIQENVIDSVAGGSTSSGASTNHAVMAGGVGCYVIDNRFGGRIAGEKIYLNSYGNMDLHAYVHGNIDEHGGEVEPTCYDSELRELIIRQPIENPLSRQTWIDRYLT